MSYSRFLDHRFSSSGRLRIANLQFSLIGAGTMDEIATANLIAQVITVLGSLGFFFAAFQALKQLEK